MDEETARDFLACYDRYDLTETDDVIETEDYDSPLDMNCVLCLRVMLWMKKLLETFLPAMIEVILRNY